jgi:hypothetical protein
MPGAMMVSPENNAELVITAVNTSKIHVFNLLLILQ